jgi:hypothetical protein
VHFDENGSGTATAGVTSLPERIIDPSMHSLDRILAMLFIRDREVN